jgi:hypothetical protein
MERMAARRRYEEAQAIREAIDDLDTLRRSYQALAEARVLRTAVLWPVEENGGKGRGREVHLDLVWDGSLSASARLDRSNAVSEIERALRSLPAPEEDLVPTLARAGGRARPAAFADSEPDFTAEPALVSVPQDRLDLLLAVRGWIANAPASCLAPCPAGAGREQAVETWRRELIDAAHRLLED